jgi:hypothetical protein
VILSALLTQLVPVSLPEFDVPAVCGLEPACRERETASLSRLSESWTAFPVAARQACAEKVSTGNVTHYSQLEACLIIEQVMAPATDAGTITTRIELRPVAAARSSHAD